MNPIESTGPCHTSPKGHVLLIDDDPTLLAFCGRILRHAGFAVSELVDPLRSSNLLGASTLSTFDVVVTDLCMPGLGGIEILKAARERDASIPVVLMTGYADVDSAAAAVEHGAMKYLKKPFTPATLVAVVEDAVGRRRVSRVQQAFQKQQAEHDARQADLNARFEQALGSLYIAFQPVVRWSDQSIVAYEALARTAEETLAAPEPLIAAGEVLGRVHDIGRAVRRRVAATLRAHPDVERVFVNLHPRELEDEDLFDPSSDLAAVASRVVLEITERATLQSGPELGRILTVLRTLGFQLAVDDFGAGYSGLSSLADIRPDVIKVDMSLIRGVVAEPTKRALIHAIVALCDRLGMLVIMEGVETIEEGETLRALGCDLFQGYHFARPGPAFPSVDWAQPEAALAVN